MGLDVAAVSGLQLVGLCPFEQERCSHSWICGAIGETLRFWARVMIRDESSGVGFRSFLNESCLAPLAVDMAFRLPTRVSLAIRQWSETNETNDSVPKVDDHSYKCLFLLFHLVLRRAPVFLLEIDVGCY